MMKEFVTFLKAFLIQISFEAWKFEHLTLRYKIVNYLTIYSCWHVWKIIKHDIKLYVVYVDLETIMGNFELVE